MIARLLCFLGYHRHARYQRCVPRGTGWVALCYCPACGRSFLEEWD